MRRDVHGHVDRDVLHARHRLGRGDQGLAKPWHLALGRITQFDIEGHIAVLRLEIFQRLAGDEVASGVRIDDGLQRGQERLGINGHEGTSSSGDGGIGSTNGLKSNAPP
ncbi:hypothetical protein FQZ97_1114030 [compost metagenome]